MPDTKGLRIPPQNVEAEMALLGSIMLRPEALYDVLDVVSAESFYSGRHAIIYEVMMDLFSKHKPIDLLSVSSLLKERNQLDVIGGNSYLSELVNMVPSSANATYYAQIVLKKYMMRRLIEASEHISLLGYEETDELEEMLDKAEKKLFEVTNTSTHHRFTALKEELDEAWDRFDRLQTSGAGLRGVSTGFVELDNKLSGFQKSDLIVRQTAVNHNTPVGVFSLEMSSQQLVDRMIAAQGNVNSWELRTGRLKHDDYEPLRDAIAVLSKAPIFIDDQPGNNIIKMRSIARRMKSEHGLGLIVVDYLQLMTPTNTKTDNLVQQTTEISRSLKNMARELDVPVLALSQLSRAVEQRGGRPRLSDLRDSGSIEQDADVVMFIHREDKYKEESEKNNIAEILIEKHRNGETGKVELYFNQQKATFQTLDKSHKDKEFNSF